MDCGDKGGRVASEDKSGLRGDDDCWVSCVCVCKSKGDGKLKFSFV